MEPLNQRQHPEAKIQKALIEYLKIRDWVVMPTHGNMFQQGFPDLYVAHFINGSRWIEVKNPKAYSFTPAQRKFFPLISEAGKCHYPPVGIWILVAATDEEYAKLFQPPNWHTYMFK